MKKRAHLLKSAYAMLVLLFLNYNISSAQTQTDDKFGFNVTLNSDQFFGFYPFITGSYSLSETTDFTFYSILWSGGTGAAWGNWTEFGVGVNLEAAPGLYVNPQIGILGGSLLSAGADAVGAFGDGIVPNLTINLDRERVEGQFYFGYYLPLRDRTPASGGTTLSYIHYWLNLGYKMSSFLSLGAHYEQLVNSGGSEVPEASTVYQWLGPYIQFSDPGGVAFTRFSFGTDMTESGDSFFKLTAGVSF